MGTSKPKGTSKNIITKELIHQLQEHCVGGFVVFYFDENGMPRQTMFFDTNIHALAMQKYMTDSAAALQDLYIEGAREDYLEARGMNCDNGDEENSEVS